jgi:3-oxoacyl-[acyl-carrier-protein] synthase II
MSHTCVANLAQNYGIIGRSIPAIAACASASMAIGAGYEAIAYGMQDTMICGGAEELHFVHAGVFDIVYAASHRYNEEPDRSPRPFDVGRDAERTFSAKF